MQVAIWKLALAVLGGAAVSVFFFGGLWLTVRRLPTARRPHLLTFGSFAARTAVTVAAIVVFAWLGWQLLVACMVGFILMRILTVRILGGGGSKPRDGGGAREGSEA